MTHILIIDDDPSARLIISRSLAREGYEVVQAENGKQGLEIAQQITPALIICDWNMPKMNGLEVCRQVKSHPDLMHTHFILLTARDEVSDLVRGLENGADDFLSKPANPSELRARVRAGIRLNRANRELQRQKQILEEELAQAARYVRSLLPSELQGEVQTQSYFLPSIQLGGDCFDYFWLDDQHLIIYLLDVSGHGVGAALLSVSVQNLLRSARSDAIAIDLTQPQAVLHKLNETFLMENHQDMFFTIWYGVYNRHNNQLSYTSAGHPPALLVTPKGTEHLGTASLPIGVVPDSDYPPQTVTVPPQSRLYVFSDGAYEIPQAEGGIWGLDNLTKTISQTSHGLEVVLQAVKGMKLEDDLSIVELYFA
ncbi:MAG: SpoIIE family protein phosphatase [Pseudanabaenaceae cyanobacterium SKYGB_i_bin29]|nr:SpoIIE family protein phosphatase [Pseudanabaenaceae cyanobacterium SKYG29]MDW8421992.1 SpoIIE family protein phosphatase [Pseudanabaenaceae cyanobacterium SKYGB_i_bin29]